MPAEPGTRRAISLWLTAVCGLLVLLVSVGGITRLTGSGLSIVKWQPISGVLPPLTAEGWARAFAEYQRFPQYRLVNAGMSLAQFKALYFWEYVHRLLGRLVALAFALPLLGLTLKRRLDRRLAIRLWTGVALFGLQGALGWIMVRSGLVDRPSVSHFRLAAHLSLALFILCYFAWTARSLRTAPTPDPEAWRLRGHAAAALALLGLQIVYGALTAGLRAGSACSTFPDWNGRPFPPEFFALTPPWWNALANPSAVQFLHRVIGTTLLVVVLSLAVRAWRGTRNRRLRAGAAAAAGAALLQFALGVATVAWRVPIPLAAAHQLGACMLLLLVLEVNHACRAAEAPALRPARSPYIAG